MSDHPAEAPQIDLATIRTLVEEARTEHEPFATAEGLTICALDLKDWPCVYFKMADALDAQAERLVRAEEERDTERLAFATAKRAYAIDGERLEAEAAEQAPVVKAALAWVDEIRTWAEDVSETDQALVDAVDEYRLALAPSEPASWPAQQRRIAERIAERYEAEAP